MNLNDLAKIWEIIKPSIEDGDIHEASDVLVNHLIDEGMTAQEIKKAFGSDKKIKEALSYFSENEDEVWEEDEDDITDTDDDWD
jgi:uncharacterized protein (DUF433 family)|tara:strand:- start:327 stop:578 length:252 start_codon:yes stop_codon:yes gene_type:complete